MSKIGNKIYTIGFTKKTAKEFFELLKISNTEVLVDIRLNNTSQLSVFSKYPDIEFFLQELCNIKYIHDLKFAPTEQTLKRYKKKEINWSQYVEEFEQTMLERKIDVHIVNKYKTTNNICLLCSEPIHKQCHRSLVANYFKNNLSEIEVIHL